MSSMTIAINGNSLGFQNSVLTCPGVSHLEVENFGWILAELIIDSTLASTLNSVLSGFTELPMESCQTLSSADVCGTCVSGY